MERRAAFVDDDGRRVDLDDTERVAKTMAGSLDPPPFAFAPTAAAGWGPWWPWSTSSSVAPAPSSVSW